MVDIIVKECRSRLDNTCFRGSVHLNRGSDVHSDIRQPICQFVASTIVVSPAGDTDIVINYSCRSK